MTEVNTTLGELLGLLAVVAFIVILMTTRGPNDEE
jgi:hypothetical protein